MPRFSSPTGFSRVSGARTHVWVALPTAPGNSAREGRHDDGDDEEGQDPDGHEASRAVIHAPTLGSRR
jgi:hypothetical protein